MSNKVRVGIHCFLLLKVYGIENNWLFRELFESVSLNTKIVELIPRKVYIFSRFLHVYTLSINFLSLSHCSLLWENKGQVAYAPSRPFKRSSVSLSFLSFISLFFFLQVCRTVRSWCGIFLKVSFIYFCLAIQEPPLISILCAITRLLLTFKRKRHNSFQDFLPFHPRIPWSLFSRIFFLWAFSPR